MVSKRMVFKMARFFFLLLGILVLVCLVPVWVCLAQHPKRGIKTDWYQNGKLFEF